MVNLTIVTKIGKNHIFVSIFSRDSHFGPYILFLLLLLPILKDVSHFCPCRYTWQTAELTNIKNILFYFILK